jgi:hypothetical protein
MDETYFVMIHNQKGNKILPLVDENDEVCMFGSIKTADHTAKRNIAAQAFGYEIFRVGCGELWR